MMDVPCSCPHDGYDPFIQKYFCDCIYDWQEYVGFVCGIASILVWLVAQLPQLIENYRNQTAEALSAWFLVDWLLGDTCNLVGCLATGTQLATQIYTAMYFVAMDVVVLTQYLYYQALNSRLRRIRQRAHSRNLPVDAEGAHAGGSYRPLPTSDAHEVVRYKPRYANESVNESVESLVGEATSSAGNTTRLACVSGLCVLGVVLHQSGSWSAEGGDPMGRVLQSDTPLSSTPKWASDAGYIIGYISSVLYLKGRISQIILNCTRKSCEGLSAVMFINAILANILYGVAIFLRLNSWQDVMNKLPWIIGSLGTVFLDAAILIQEKVSSVAVASRTSTESWT